MPPTYRDRLRLEGLTLAGAGALQSAVLLAAAPQARRWPWNTVAQLVAVAGLLVVLAPRATQRAMDAAEPLAPGQEGSGEPTPLWHVPIPMLLFSAVVIFPNAPGAGWDAGLRVSGGCVLVGLAQAGLIARLVEREERRRGRRFLRVKGSRLGRGTRLGSIPHIGEATMEDVARAG